MANHKDSSQSPADKGREERHMGERFGRPEEGPPLHPQTKETGTKGASNAGEDLTSGDG
jgi:hypothetical protein